MTRAIGLGIALLIAVQSAIGLDMSIYFGSGKRGYDTPSSAMYHRIPIAAGITLNDPNIRYGRLHPELNLGLWVAHDGMYATEREWTSVHAWIADYYALRVIHQDLFNRIKAERSSWLDLGAGIVHHRARVASYGHAGRGQVHWRAQVFLRQNIKSSAHKGTYIELEWQPTLEDDLVNDEYRALEYLLKIGFRFRLI